MSNTSSEEAAALSEESGGAGASPVPREEDTEVLDLTEALEQIRVEEDSAVLFEEEETMELAAWKDLPLFNGEDKKNIDSWMGRA